MGTKSCLLFEPCFYDMLDVGAAGAVRVDVVELHQRGAILETDGACGQTQDTSTQSW